MNDWDRVIAAVVIRRSELGLTQKELALRAGVAERTIQNLEAGTRPQPLIRGKIERALGWPVGEMGRIASAPASQQVDVLAEQFGAEKAARLRRVLEKRGEAGAIVLAELEKEFSSRGEDAAPAESRPGRAASLAAPMRPPARPCRGRVSRMPPSRVPPGWWLRRRRSPRC